MLESFSLTQTTTHLYASPRQITSPTESFSNPPTAIPSQITPLLTTGWESPSISPTAICSQATPRQIMLTGSLAWAFPIHSPATPQRTTTSESTFQALAAP